MNKKTALIIVCWLTVLSGCVIYTEQEPLTQFYYQNPNKDLSTIGKVALVELANNSSYPTINSSITKALYQALQKKQFFSLSVIQEDHPGWHILQQKNNTSYTYKQISEIKKSLKCDAIIFGNVTEYHPYPHMTMGLCLKMIDLKDGQLIWAVEEVWDTSDKKTEYRIDRYFNTNTRSGLMPLHKELMAVSPIKFQKFVAYEIAETLKNNEVKFSKLH
ncbi:MAG: hypothetical protein ACYSUK_01815 [Planctomycetota bacterium]|jgi:hypothetical protein